MNSNQRIFYYDFLRAFAIFAVILCHVDGIIGYSFWNLKVALPGLLTTIALTGVPIFFMLSGALLLNRKYSLKEFYKKRFSRIFYPFLFWMIISIIIGILYLNWTKIDALNVFFGITSHTWYIWVLIGIYLIIPIINSFFKEYGLKGLEFFLIIWIITILFNSYCPHYLKTLELSYFSGYIGYVILGYYLDNKKFKTLYDKLKTKSEDSMHQYFDLNKSEMRSYNIYTFEDLNAIFDQLNHVLWYRTPACISRNIDMSSIENTGEYTTFKVLFKFSNNDEMTLKFSLGNAEDTEHKIMLSA